MNDQSKLDDFVALGLNVNGMVQRHRNAYLVVMSFIFLFTYISITSSF